MQNRKDAWMHTRSTRILPLVIFAGSKSRPRFSKPLQKQPGTPCAAQQRASATAVVSCIQAGQGGLSLLFHPKHRWDPGRICTRDSSTCCTFPAGRVNAPSDTLSCTLASLQGFITCLWAARGFFSFNYPLRYQYPLCCWSLEEDEG